MIASKPSKTAAEHSAREAAFLQLTPPPFTGVPDRLLDPAGRPFGPPLAKLTPWRHHLLLGYESPFVTGGICTADQLLQALWLCSPQFVAGSRLRFRFYRLRWAWFAVRHLQSAGAAFSAWLDAPFDLQPCIPQETTRDTPDGRPIADCHWLADRMLLGSFLGLEPLATLHVPYAVLWSLLRAKTGSDVPGVPRFNRERDRQTKDYLAKKRSRQETKGVGK